MQTLHIFFVYVHKYFVCLGQISHSILTYVSIYLQVSIYIIFSFLSLSIISQGLCFKVRDYHPCLLSDVQFDIDLPEEDEIQVRTLKLL